MSLTALARLAVAAACAATLSGCGPSADDELQTWLREERAHAKPQIQPIPAAKPFAPQRYAGQAGDDPFAQQRLMQLLRTDTASSGRQEALKLEANRRKEPLEAYPLDALTFVGTIARAGRTVALVKGDNLLFQIERGARLGQNNGQVTKITETELTLREVVQDGVGEWIERPATLQLQERAK